MPALLPLKTEEPGEGRNRRFGGYMNPKTEYFRVPIMKNEEIIERPADQTTITQRYTDEAIAFMRANRTRPFFVYLAHNMPHMPLFRSKEFENRSVRGKDGDVIEEIDANVFTSDNGPWSPYLEQGGSAGLLRGEGQYMGRRHARAGDLLVARHHPAGGLR